MINNFAILHNLVGSYDSDECTICEVNLKREYLKCIYRKYV